ncbi:MAG: SDR family NAD(P)-dependent oxidoreductase [Lacrimispora sp.]
MKTIAIIGAGKNLGLSLAKRFGKEGFQIALVARNGEKLQTMADELKDLSVEVTAFPADISKKEDILKTLADIKTKYGTIDVLEFSPLTWDYPPASVLEMTPESVIYHFENQVMSAINIVNHVVPDMITRGEGALLFTTGLSAFHPIPMMGNAGIAMAGLRNYLTNLTTELLTKGILVANRSVAVQIGSGIGKENDPDTIADMWYQVYENRDSGEAIYPQDFDPKVLSAVR